MRFLRYCRDVFFAALRPSISWAQSIITLIILVVGCGMWLAAAFNMIIDPSNLVTMVPQSNILCHVGISGRRS
jgi:hypothetical protein